jgi:hypothetical protein
MSQLTEITQFIFGQPLSEIRRLAERPTLDELRERLERRPETRLSTEPAQAVRAERDHNDRD